MRKATELHNKVNIKKQFIPELKQYAAGISTFPTNPNSSKNMNKLSSAYQEQQ